MNNKGYSILELVVSLMVIAFVSSITVANINHFKQKGQSESAAMVLASDIRQAQDFSLGLKEYSPGLYPPGGWGIILTRGSSLYRTFFDYWDGSGGAYDKKYSDITENFEIVNMVDAIVSEIKINGVDMNFLNLTYEPPDPTVHICDNSTPAVCGSSTEIILKGTSLTTEINANDFGLVDIVGVGESTLLCASDGYNGICPVPCTGAEDPDCGCVDNNGGCGILCRAVDDNDCFGGCGNNNCQGTIPFPNTETVITCSYDCGTVFF